ncbi:MAG: His/Gly/Thr/Pro-type tRNA ligase C-terminal domain-containing protein, partial [SAR324 cluster bacterium]|nr:His/Gly/Thr/Pro-type tRNA ligase C-terminal domain-containing protein [SAR324 cluster bacterium]
WEKRTRLFLRTSEFLWQEGHTAHETYAEAQEETLKMLEVYRSFQEDDLAIPVIPGQKSEAEKFPGALSTYTVEAMMQDGKALQSATSHNLGQNFAKAFEIQFLDRNNQQSLAWTTSWGSSTRMIGGLIMTHSDDDGLVLPPRIAPVAVALVPIFANDQERSQTLEFAEKIKQRLAEHLDHLRIQIDDRDNLRPGDKFFHWIQQGVPVRVEIGPRDVKQQSAMVARRDVRDKKLVPLDEIADHVMSLLQQIQWDLYQRALDFREANTRTDKSYGEFKEILEQEGGFIRAHWNGTREVEDLIKNETKATIRCIPLNDQPEAGKCILTGEHSQQEVIFAIAY